MLLSAVSVLVVAQSSSEIPEGLTNNPVYYLNNNERTGQFYQRNLSPHLSPDSQPCPVACFKDLQTHLGFFPKENNMTVQKL